MWKNNWLVVTALVASAGFCGAGSVARAQLNLDALAPPSSDSPTTGSGTSGGASTRILHAMKKPPAPPRLPTIGVLDGKRNLAFQVGGAGFWYPRLGQLRFYRVGVGVTGPHVGVDLRAKWGNGTFGAIFSEPSYSDLSAQTDSTAGYGDPNSELNRIRWRASEWKFTLFEPGLMAQLRPWPYSLPRLTCRARFGVGRGSFQDLENALTFGAWLVSYEAALQFQLWSRSRLRFELAAEYQAGSIVSAKAETNQQGRLPVHFFGVTTGLSYWF